MMSVFVVMGQDVYTRSTCNSVIKYFYTFQQSFVLMCDIASFLNTELLHLNFGFDDDLVLQYFYPDEVSKRLDYQHAMLLETKNFRK